MAAAPLRELVAAEAAGATLVGGALLIWTGDAATRLALPATPPSWAVMRLVAVMFIAFGSVLWVLRDRVTADRALIRALAIGHAVVAAVLMLQHVAIWNTTAGFIVAVTPLALAFRYTQYAMRATAT